MLGSRVTCPRTRPLLQRRPRLRRSDVQDRQKIAASWAAHGSTPASMAKLKKKAKRPGHAARARGRLAPTAVSGDRNGNWNGSLVSRALRHYVWPLFVAAYLAYAFSTGNLPSWPGSRGGGGGAAADGGGADPAAGPLLIAPVCRANLSHPVRFEQLAHIKIWTIESFLPQDQALALHARLAAEPVPAEGADGRAWVYTSNRVTNQGRGTNHKVRGNKDIADRRGRAQWARDLGSFAYSKNELNASHPTYGVIRDAFVGGAGAGGTGAEGTAAGETAAAAAAAAVAPSSGPTPVVRCISNLTGLDLVEVTDMFVSMYVQGDFLTTHQDFNLGSYAFVLQLTKDWGLDDGGELVFYCGRERRPQDVCKVARPQFNTLMLFSTRPQLVDHYVEQVRVAPGANRRFAVTGWVASSDDEGFDKNTVDMKIQKGVY